VKCIEFWKDSSKQGAEREEIGFLDQTHMKKKFANHSQHNIYMKNEEKEK
jgi:hypothetical protein